MLQVVQPSCTAWSFKSCRDSVGTQFLLTTLGVLWVSLAVIFQVLARAFGSRLFCHCKVELCQKASVIKNNFIKQKTASFFHLNPALCSSGKCFRWEIFLISSSWEICSTDEGDEMWYWQGRMHWKKLYVDCTVMSLTIAQK